MNERKRKALVNEFVSTSWLFTFIDREDAVMHLFDAYSQPSTVKIQFYREGRPDWPDQYGPAEFTESEDFYQATLADSLESVLVVAGDDDSGRKFGVIWFPINGMEHCLMLRSTDDGCQTEDEIGLIKWFTKSCLCYARPRRLQW